MSIPKGVGADDLSVPAQPVRLEMQSLQTSASFCSDCESTVAVPTPLHVTGGWLESWTVFGAGVLCWHWQGMPLAFHSILVFFLLMQGGIWPLGWEGHHVIRSEPPISTSR